MRLLRLALYAFLWVQILTVKGQTPDPDSDPKAMPEIQEQLVVTAQLTPEKSEQSLYRVKVIGKERLAAQAPTTLRELLGQELGLSLTQHSVFGSGLSLQGVSGENVKILRDGIPVIGRLNGIIDLDQINLHGVDRIEVIEGPASIFHGSDALGGVVNLISKIPESSGLQTDLTSYYRDVGELSNQARANLVRGNHQFELRAAIRDFQGYSQAQGLRRLAWAERDQESGSFRYARPWQNLRLVYSADLFRENLVDLGEPVEALARDVTYRTQRHGQHLSLSGLLARDFYLDTTLSYSGYRRDQAVNELDALTGAVLHEGSPDRETRFDEWLVRAVLNAPDAKHWGFKAGAAFSLEEGSGGRLLDDGQNQSEAALFAALRWSPVARLQIQPALRLTDNSNYGGLLTSAVHLKLDAAENVSLRASYAEGYRGPSLKETYLDFTTAAGPFVYHISGNPDLDPERGRNLQASLFTHHRLGNIGPISFETVIFDNRINDLIVLSALIPENGSANRFQREYINIATHRTRGGQINLTLKGSLGTVGLGLSRTEVANQAQQGTTTPDFSGRYDGRLQGSLAPGSGRTALHVFYKVQGRQPGLAVRDGELEEVHVESAQWLDLSVSHKLLGDLLSIQAGGKNLLDVRDLNTVVAASGTAHSRAHADWGRSYYLRLQLSWRP